ncbi:NLR family CARD domain-containing protein 4 [Holothuria leucospilota]|uniref:NLR family CARD domain-containing protein 4 n=1 Tax=Holothuria leucospilota TaxID=206669 RepID=A0A9Q1BX98_HOLLE|nr:NLR family CARD domain-containing protein 4 [Holothuria leucospilota]
MKRARKFPDCKRENHFQGTKCVNVKGKVNKQRRIIDNKLEESEEGENVPMVDPKIAEIKKIFTEQLKVKYQTLYDAVQPIPYIKDKLYCVDSVYVERGIEVMVARDQTGQKEIWESLDSYHNLIPKLQVASKRSLLEGEAGYGKSTLTLQLAYDWCNRVDRSPLKDVDVLVILLLRQLGGMPSIYQAIRQFLLPKDTVLEVSDIENIIQKTASVVIILDGYDEYPDQDKLETDVINIIQRDMFQQIHVILTTRSSCIPQEFAPHTRRVRLNGFDETARDKYIRKAIAGSDDMVAKRIKRRLIENPVLGDLCQVPLFFVMFAHMTHEREEVGEFNSVTSFFSYMISCFHSHMRNKLKDKNVNEFNDIEANHRELDKLALEGLCEVRMVWDRNEMCSKLGEGFYKHYIKIGILIEDEILDMQKGPELFEYKIEVRFYHKIFCEWYAAHLLADYAVDNSFSDLRETLKRLDPFDLHYVYRFACGLKPSAAENILQYLKSIREGEQFSMLCILEQKGKMDNIRETVADLCSDVVVIANKDNKLQLRSTIQLLEIASSNAIPIASVSIENCFQSVDLDAWNILLGSGLCFSNLSSVEELRINEMGRELTTREVETIFKFASQCLKLRTLRFDCCFLPQSLSLKKFETDINPNEIEVQWIPLASWFRLNNDTGTWEDRFKGKIEVITSEKYETEMQRFRKEWSHTHWQMSRITKNGQET